MHELGLALDIIERAERAAGQGRVTRIVVVVGKLAAVLPDALRFCFDLAAEDTAVAGALPEIVEEPGRARCRACGGEVALERPFGRCACGSSDLEWLAGEAITLAELEVH